MLHITTLAAFTDIPEIATSTERAPGARQDDHANGLVLSNTRERIIQSADEFVVQGIQTISRFIISVTIPSCRASRTTGATGAVCGALLMERFPSVSFPFPLLFDLSHKLRC